MAKVSVTKSIAAPVEIVFALATDIERFPERIKGITKVEKLTPGPVGVGTRFRETRIMFKKEATEEMEFTSLEPNRGYTLGCESCGCRYSSRFTFEPEGSGTKMTMEFEAQPLTFFAKVMGVLIGWMMSGMIKKCVAQDMEDLKTAAESAVPTAV